MELEVKAIESQKKTYTTFGQKKGQVKGQGRGDFWEQHTYLEESGYLQLILPSNEAPKTSDKFPRALVLSKLQVGSRSVQLDSGAGSSSELESASALEDSLPSNPH